MLALRPLLILSPLLQLSSALPLPSVESRKIIIGRGVNSAVANSNAVKMSEAEGPPEQLRLVHRSSVDMAPVSSLSQSIASVLFHRSTVFWAGATGLGLWFFLLHAPVALKGRHVIGDPLFVTHLLGAGSIYFACMHNSLLNPSLGRFVRFCHVNLGRIGFVLGVVGFVTGFILTWTRVGMTNPGFSIGITIGGFSQMYAQYSGYQAIQRYRRLKGQEEILNSGSYVTPADARPPVSPNSARQGDSSLSSSAALALLADQKEEAIRQHVSAMIPLFVCACGIPAIIRVSEKISDNVAVLLASIGFLQLMAAMYTKSFLAARAVKGK
jgi:hypothetical protein